MEPSDLITLTEARKLLNVSRPKLTDLVRKRLLTYYENPLDAREKLVSKADVLGLIPKKEKAA